MNIPQELRGLRQWIVWRLEDKGREKPTKVPYSVHGGFAKTNDPSTWDTFEAAQAIVAAGGYSGVGFVFTGTPYVGIDLDGAIGDDGALGENSTAILKMFEDSYVEVSQSGKGVHIIVKGKLPPGGRRKGPVEAYDGSSPRYFALTGNTAPLTGRDLSAMSIPEANGRLAEFHARWIGTGVTEPELQQAAKADDPRVVELVRKAKAASPGFSAMYNFGETRPGKSASESDSWMARELARWERDAGVIHAAMMGSALKRPRWTERRPRSPTGDLIGLAIADALEAVALGNEGMDSFRFLNAAELEHEPEPMWLIPGVIPQAGLCVLFGKSSGGKSFLALAWAMDLARGGKAVVYVAAEGWAGTKRRVNAWAVTNGALEALPPVVFMSGNANLMDPSRIASFVSAACEKLGRKPDLVIFDTLNQNMPGGDENAAADMAGVIGSANLIRRETGATVLLLHHPRKADEVERGHSSLANAADTMMRLTVDGTTNQRILECTKQKDAAPFARILYDLKPVPGHVSLVMVPADPSAAPPSEVPADSQASTILEIIRGLSRPGSPARPRDIEAEMIRVGLNENAAHVAVGRALRALADDYRVIVKVRGGYQILTSEERAALRSSDEQLEARLDNR